MRRRRKKYCPKCGDRVRHAEYYCKHCGKRLRFLPVLILLGLSISVVVATVVVLLEYVGNASHKFN